MKKFLKILLAAVVSALYLSYLRLCVARLPMNSDGATMLLYADEVLSGNVFLSGWSLSGLTFLTTDLPFYLLGVISFGVSLKAYHLAVFLMYAVFTLTSVMVALTGVKHKWTAFCLFGTIGLIPTTFALSNAFVHTGVFALFFLSVFFILKYEQTESGWFLLPFFIFTALAVSGDTMALAIITLPVIICCFMKIFKKAYLPFVTVLLGSGAGIFLQKVFLHLGGAELNALNHRHFVACSEIYGNLVRYCEYFLKLLNSYFFTKSVFSVKTVVFAVIVLIALFALYLIFSSVKAAVLKKETDSGICLTGIALSVVSLVLFFTTLNANITAGRYILFMPATLGIALSRCTDIFIPLEKKAVKAVVIILCIGLMSANIVSTVDGVSPVNTHSRMADFLRINNLTNGYGCFWDASVITGYSNDTVKVRAVTFEDDKINPQVWFCNKKWYNEKGNFYIVRKGENPEEITYNMENIYTLRLDSSSLYGKWTEQIGNMTEENVIKALGKPKKILDFENYSILIY